MSESETSTPLKHQLAVIGLIAVLGVGVYVATRGNPYATPQLTFRTCMDAVARRDADAAWACVDSTDRTKCGFIARRSGQVGASDDPLQALFDQGIERYPDLADAVLESVAPTQDPDRVTATISWGRWQVELPMVRQDEAWRFDKVSEVALGGVRPRRQPAPE